MILRGKIQHFESDKKYGFIRGEDGKNYFFHKSALDENVLWGKKLLYQLVEFEVIDTDRGPRAVKVRFVT